MYPEERADYIVHNLKKRVSDLEWNRRLELWNASQGVRFISANGPQVDGEA